MVCEFKKLVFFKKEGEYMKTLKELREERGLTQQDMANKLGYSGKSGYSMLENGDVKNITMGKLLIIADAFNLSIDELKNFLFK